METKNTLIDRYLAAVGDLLPAKLRKDTVTEIRSLIQDTLDDRSKEQGQPPDDAMVTALLKEFGPPEKIVAPYLPERYLIGPNLYPTFILVLQIALPIIALLVLLSSWIGTSITSPITTAEFLTQLVRSLGNALSAVVQAFGNIVIIFALLQLATPVLKEKKAEWDPHSLKAVRQPDKIKRGELIAEIAFTLIGLIIFNFYFNRIGIYSNLNGEWSFTPILTDAFRSYTPWLSLVWILTILLDIYLLRRSSWDIPTRLFSILLSAINIAIAVSMMTNIQNLFHLSQMDILRSLGNQFLVVIFVIVIITSAIKIIQMMWQIVKSVSQGTGEAVG